MTTVAVLINEPGTKLARLQDAFARHETTVDRVELHAGASFPDLESVDGVVALGGSMGSYQDDQYPYLTAEKAYLRRAVEQDLPVLGICLGSQLLADALGGRVYLAARGEAGVVAIELTEEGRLSPMIGHLSGWGFQAHQDTFEIPPDAVLLAHSQLFPQAFSLGSALGIQFHAETDAATAVSWMQSEPEHTLLRRAGVALAEYSDQVWAHEETLARDAEMLFDRWIASL